MTDDRIAAIRHLYDRNPDIAWLTSEVETLRALVTELVDADPCRYDHHGYCQTHSLHEKPCPHEQAKDLGLGRPQ